MEHLQGELDGLPSDRLLAELALFAHLLHKARVTHEAVFHLVELAVDEPRTAHSTLEALGMPATFVVLEVAHCGADALLAALALGHWLHAISTKQVVFHNEKTFAL